MLLPQISNEVFEILERKYKGLNQIEFVKRIKIRLLTENPVYEQYAQKRAETLSAKFPSGNGLREQVRLDVLFELFLSFCICEIACKIAKKSKGDAGANTQRDKSYLNPPLTTGEDGIKAIDETRDLIKKLRNPRKE